MTSKKSRKTSATPSTKNSAKAATGATGNPGDARQINEKIKELADRWGETLRRVRELIRKADPEVGEEVKWRKPSNSMKEVPVCPHDGIICTGETSRGKVKLTFAKGAALEDPANLFNSSLGGKVRRAIDIHEGATIDEMAFKALIRAAVALNVEGVNRPA